MKCLYCGGKTHRHGKSTATGAARRRCVVCRRTFAETYKGRPAARPPVYMGNIIAMRQEGISMHRIARLLGVHPEAVRRAILNWNPRLHPTYKEGKPK